MTLAPKYAGLKLLQSGGSSSAVHTLDLYLDYVCPFSKKMFKTFYESVYPSLRTNYGDKLTVIFRPQIQPWHPSSTLTHEAATAVLLKAPDKFWDFSARLFDHQTEFFDVNVVNEPRNETYRRLCKLADGLELNQEELFQALKISDNPGPEGSLNSGNMVTNDVKFLVKANRLLSIHVTPTVLFNGIIENSISSSFTKEQWEDWLRQNIK